MRIASTGAVPLWPTPLSFARDARSGRDADPDTAAMPILHCELSRVPARLLEEQKCLPLQKTQFSDTDLPQLPSPCSPETRARMSSPCTSTSQEGDVVVAGAYRTTSDVGGETVDFHKEILGYLRAGKKSTSARRSKCS